MVYPVSANFPTLNNDFCSCGRMSISHVWLGSVGIGSIAFLDPWIMLPSGRCTCFDDGTFVRSIFIFSVAKCDVAPELIIIVSLLFPSVDSTFDACSLLMLFVSSFSSYFSIVLSGAH